jgi:hypothetical protein
MQAKSPPTAVQAEPASAEVTPPNVPEAAVTPLNVPEVLSLLPQNKRWQYVPEIPDATRGDRRNDGHKFSSLFKLPPPVVDGPNRRSSRIAHNVPAPALIATSPEVYDPALDILMSSLESRISPDLCLMSTPGTTALHTTFCGEFDQPDPKSQKEIDKLPPEHQKRYNDATMTEFLGMKAKQVMELIPASRLPRDTKIYPAVVNWTTKKVLGVYSKTKCRICFGGHRYNKLYTDCFAPTVNFTSVLIILCLAAIFGWHLGSLDYSQAYLNADIDEFCVMRAPEFLREYDDHNNELYWRLKKVIYGHPKGSRLWADCLHKKLIQFGFKQFKTDQCFYGKWDNWNKSSTSAASTITIILVHSDDLIIATNNPSNLDHIKTILLSAFDGVDQGDLTSFCGVEIRATPPCQFRYL